MLLVLAGAAVVIVESLSLVRNAKRAQASLEAFKTDLQNNDSAAAARDLHNANAWLAAAHGRYDSIPLRVSRHVPLLGWPVSDAGRLLSAADEVSSAGSDALGLYDQVRGSGSKLFHNNTVSLPELEAVTRDADGIVVKMDRAERQLRSVHAAFWEPSVGAARDKALRQVVSLRGDGLTAQRLLRLAPRLVGADGPRTYLVAVLNPAELQGAGGSALNMLTVRFDQGRMKIVQSGSTFDLTNENTPTKFTPLPDDPWLAGSDYHVLAAADRSPDFRTSGPELMRGYSAQFGVHLDGVIALDPIALQGLMQQIPPFTTPGYGQLTAKNLVQTLLVDSYAKFPDYKVRHAYNDQLMTTLLHRVLGGGHMIGKGKALKTAADAGHLQIFMNDPVVQTEVASSGLLRTLPPAGRGDVVGVFTTNTNASKVDYWQRRQVSEVLQIGNDGSVSGVRTIALANPGPAYAGPGSDPGSGYLSRVSRPKISVYLPAQATVTSVQVNGRARRFDRFAERGLQVVSLHRLRLPRGTGVTVVVRYTLPAGTVRGGRVPISVVPQTTIQPVPLRISVAGPGNCRGSGPGWAADGARAAWSAASTPVANTTVVCR